MIKPIKKWDTDINRKFSTDKSQVSKKPLKILNSLIRQGHVNKNKSVDQVRVGLWETIAKYTWRLRGAISGSGRNLCQEKLPGIYKDDPI